MKMNNCFEYFHSVIDKLINCNHSFLKTCTPTPKILKLQKQEIHAHLTSVFILDIAEN